MHRRFGFAAPLVVAIGLFFAAFQNVQAQDPGRDYYRAGAYADGRQMLNNLNQNHYRLAAGQLINRTDWELIGGKSCPFLWLKIPERQPSAGYAASLLRRKRILTLPGTAFGETCDGYLRLSLTASTADYEEATKRISKKFVLLSRPDDESEED